MTSIKDWQDSMRAADGWDEAVDLIDEDDVKRWNADPKMNPQKFKSARSRRVECWGRHVWRRMSVGERSTHDTRRGRAREGGVWYN